MRRYLLILLPLLLAFRPDGEPEFFAWVEPTAREDGTPLAPSAEIAAYIMRCTQNGADVFNMTVGVGGTNRWDVPANTFGAGNWVCALYARDQEARTSAPSGAVEFLVQTYVFTVAPAAPSALSLG